jgi:hypothetical protein
MSTQVRRIVIHLAAVPTPGPASVAMRRPPDPKGGILASDMVTLRGVDVERNVIPISFAAGTLHQPDQAIPLDDVEAVWQRDDGTWCVHVGGGLECTCEGRVEPVYSSV